MGCLHSHLMILEKIIFASTLPSLNLDKPQNNLIYGTNKTLQICNKSVLRFKMVLLYLYIFLFCVFSSNSFKVPQVLIEPQEPKGIRVSIPHIEGIALFTFHGTLNNQNIVRTLGIPRNGRWSFTETNAKWKPGDVLNYWTYIEFFDGQRNLKYNTTSQQIIGEETQGDGEDLACTKSVTTVNGRNINCKEALVFEDSFINFDNAKWKVENYIPAKGPSYEFNSYEESTVRVTNNTLIILPSLKLTDDSVRGVLDLTHICTSIYPQDECRLQQRFAMILPPVKSGKITSKSTFKYFKIEITAKLPAGDWIFPEIALVPKDKTDRETKIWIAYARGNQKFQGNDRIDTGAHLLFCGPIKSSSEPERSENLATRRAEVPFTSDYHTYTLIWHPTQITCFVDNLEVGKVITRMGFQELNTEFHISLGVGIGGTNDFPDGYKSGGTTKPWTNKDSKQTLSFFNAREQWLPTWKDVDHALKVRSVKVYSISKDPEDHECISKTNVNGRVTNKCRGTLIFEDSFNNLDHENWQVEQYNPSVGPTYEFNDYEKDAVNVWNSKLVIKPEPKRNYRELLLTLQKFEGENCTSAYQVEECRRYEYHFMPLVKSGKITSRSTFKYTKIEIRAKLPAGDWIFPEVSLVPKDRKNRQTKIRVAYARGNQNLQATDGSEIGARLLHCGPIKSSSEGNSNMLKTKGSVPYTSGYHTYTLIWLPNEITCLVDDTVFGKIDTTSGFPQLNTEFHISLGVVVGGHTDFPHDAKSGQNTRPWSTEVQKVTMFYEKKDLFSSAFQDDDCALIVDYVRVYSV